jgi:signal transduction histidine kinase/DNA-binding response OmpR family regulator
MDDVEPTGHGTAAASIVVEDVIAALRTQLGEVTDAETLRAALNAVEMRFAPATSSQTLPPHTLDVLQLVLDRLPVAVSWFNENLQLLACNSQYKQLLELPEAMFADGMPYFEDLVRLNARRGEYGAGDPEEIARAVVAGAVHTEPHLFQRTRPNGVVLEVYGTPLAGGGFVAVHTDITTHKHAEQVAQRNLAYLQAVIEQLPQGLTVIDENLDIVLWNRLWEKNCGGRPGFLYPGVTFADAVRHLSEMGEYGPGSTEEHVATRVELARRFEPHCFRRLRRNGQVIEVEGRPLHIDGKVAGFITMYNDITDRLAFADLKKAKEDAEAANRMKSEFLALISHEIRTPLAGVIGMLGFAVRDPYLQAGTMRQVMSAQDNAQALLAIINDLLDFSKIEAGKLSLEHIDFSLQEHVEQVVALFRDEVASRGLSLTLNLGPKLPQFVRGDPTRLRQVLMNLIGNAIKFTRQGSILIGVHGLGYEGEVSDVGFSVSDTGIGIAPDALERVFEKFEQADLTTTRRFGGTGLGLSICRHLVALMGGVIEVESELDVGSTFSFVLPLPDGKRPVTAAQASPPAHSHRLRVLCAEDFSTNQIIIRTLVEEFGHHVDIVENGALAVAAVAKAHYDVILMDGRMPEMDGVTATRLIRAGGPPEAAVLDAAISIIAVTANASAEDRSRFLAAGMDDFLAKPIHEQALHRQLAQVIERQLQRGVVLSPRVTASARQSDATDNLADLLDLPQSARNLARTHVDAKSDAVAEAFKRQMRGSFVDDIKSKQAQLASVLAARDCDAAGRLFHGIRGSAGYLDLEELSALCSVLEPAADRGDWTMVEEALPRLLALLNNC